MSQNFKPLRTPSAPEFQQFLEQVIKQVEHVEGWLTPREIEFIALLGAYPKAAGAVMEIGSYRGRSTIVLAKAVELSDNALIHAVDPLEDWGDMIEDGQGKLSARALLDKNFADLAVTHKIKVHQNFSQVVAPTWSEKLRVLWIDGDHSYRGALQDFENFSPHLAPGGVIAFHDVMTAFECGRVFLDKVVKSSRFHKVGICGSIGWGQFTDRAASNPADTAAKARLARQLERVESYDKNKIQTSKIYRLGFKMNRWLVNHGPMVINQWRQVA